MKEKQKNIKGISLIVLIVTIVVIIILATGIIMAVLNNNPISNAKEAVLRNDLQVMKEAYGMRYGELLLKYEGDTSKITEEDYADVVQEKYKDEVYPFIEGLAYVGKDEKRKEVAESMGYIIGNPNDAVLKAWTYDSQDDFHAEEYRTKITKIKFITSNKVPDNVIDSWDVSAGNNGGVMAWIVDDGEDGYELTIGGNTKVVANTNSSCMFLNFSAVKDIDIEVLNTSNVTNMFDMFQGCSSLRVLDLSNFSTSNVTNMQQMFYGCSQLKSIIINLDNSKSLKNVHGMFENCYSLVNLDVSHFNTSNITNMHYMFRHCSNLKYLDVSNFTTSNVIDMLGMFEGCSSLASIDVSGFDTGKVTSMQHMFYNCRKLNTSITIKNIGTTSYNGMFSGAATEESSEIKVNYTAETEELVDNMINTKSDNSHVIKGEKINIE